MKRKLGRPKGTTKAKGYKVSSGRPKNIDWFIKKITKGFKNILSPAFKKGK